VWLATVLLIAAAAPASAQYRIDSWTTEHGLPASSVTDVVQTRDGFLWIATYGGLARFDGAKFRTFDMVTTPGLPSSRITELVDDPDGGLWVKTEALALVRYADDVFKTMTPADGLPARADRLLRSASGGLIVLSGTTLVEWKNGRFEPLNTSFPLRGDGRTILGAMPSGRVWFADAAGMHRYDIGRPLQNVALPFVASRVWEDRGGRLWMTYQGGLYSLTNGSLLKHDDPLVRPIDLTKVIDDREGTVWWGGSNGVLRFRDGAFLRLTTADGLPSDTVAVLYEDREGTIWVATEGGLARLTPRAITTYTTAEGLEADNSYAILQDRHGDIWVGGWPGLNRRRSNGAFEPASAAFGLTGAKVLALMEDREGAIWVGMLGGGVRRIANGAVTAFPQSATVPGTTRVIYQGRGPDVWFGARGGLFRYRDNAFTLFAPPKAFGGGEVNALHEDRTGALWIGHADGLSRHAGGAFTAFAARDGFTGGAVRAFHEDRDGSIWIGTYDTGLFRYRDGRFTRYTTLEGLPTNGAFRILEDGAGRFWICSNVGIYRAARSDLEEIAAGRRATLAAPLYGRRDGMRNQECNGGAHPAGIRAADGRMWFPTQTGVAVFDPASVPVRTAPPPVVITDLFVANTRTSARDTIRIASGVRTVEMHYAALTYFEPELARFKYRMEGLDADWVDAGDQRVARYGQLPFGSFRFRVIAANRDGIWNEEGASVAVVVVRPFWRTQWFFALVAFGAIGAALGVHRWRMGMLRQQKALGEAFSRQLIETQEEERRRVAAALHDSLSQTLMLMKNWATIGQSALPPDHEARAPMGDISEAASQALAEVREISYNLGPFQLERIGLAQMVADLADKVSRASGIRVTSDLALLDGRLSADRQIAAFRVIQEALNNVIKHSGATAVAIMMQIDPEGVRIGMHDNGRGFDPTAASAATRKQGFGLFGMAERMRLAGGRLHIESSASGGTLVELELPSAGASV
jgi:signal transduction histidine kinase/ligand-binding sensor domain-containing protein